MVPKSADMKMKKNKVNICPTDPQFLFQTRCSKDYFELKIKVTIRKPNGTTY